MCSVFVCVWIQICTCSIDLFLHSPSEDIIIPYASVVCSSSIFVTKDFSHCIWTSKFCSFRQKTKNYCLCSCYISKSSKSKRRLIIVMEMVRIFLLWIILLWIKEKLNVKVHGINNENVFVLDVYFNSNSWIVTCWNRKVGNYHRMIRKSFFLVYSRFGRPSSQIWPSKNWVS